MDHLIWHLPGQHQVIESSETHQGFSLPERGLNEDEPARRIVQTYEVAERAVIGLDQLLGPTSWNYGQESMPGYAKRS